MRSGKPALGKPAPQRCRLWVLPLVAAISLLFDGHILRAGLQSHEQTAVFRAATDLVVIDTHVVDRRGSPIEGLKAEQFEVFIDGRRRPVVAVDYVVRAVGTHAAVPAAGAGPTATTAAGSGRIIVIGIDQASFPVSARASAREAALRVVNTAAPEDYVGLVAFPSDTQIAPTRDRERVREAIGFVTGLRVETLVSRFNVSASEALALKAREPVSTGDITSRECERDFRNPTCKAEVIDDGIVIANALEHQSVMSLTGLHGVIDALASIPGRKTLMLISAGLPMSNRPGSKSNLSAEIDGVARRAAAANVNLYVLYMNVHFLRYFSAEYGRKNNSIFEDISMFGSGLERFADTAGGSFFQVEVDSDPYVERAFRETSATYVLAIKAEPAEQDGKPHFIRVAVRARNAMVRYRQVVMIPSPPR